jgi:hypothetical protein
VNIWVRVLIPVVLAAIIVSPGHTQTFEEGSHIIVDAPSARGPSDQGHPQNSSHTAPPTTPQEKLCADLSGSEKFRNVLAELSKSIAAFIKTLPLAGAGAPSAALDLGVKSKEVFEKYYPDKMAKLPSFTTPCRLNGSSVTVFNLTDGYNKPFRKAILTMTFQPDGSTPISADILVVVDPIPQYPPPPLPPTVHHGSPGRAGQQ